MSGDADGSDARAEGSTDLSRRDVFRAGAAAAAMIAGLSLAAPAAQAAPGGRRSETLWRVVVGTEEVQEIATVTPEELVFNVSSYPDSIDGWYRYSVYGVQPFQVVVALTGGVGTVLPAWFDATAKGSDDVREVRLELRSRAGDLLRSLVLKDARVVKFERPSLTTGLAGRTLLDTYTLHATDVEIG